jgi:hypothetical protein
LTSGLTPRVSRPSSPSSSPRIEPIMQAAGVTSEPEVVFWRKLETDDDYGWE